MTVRLTAIQGAVPSKVVPKPKWCLYGDITIAAATPLARGFILLNEPSCEELVMAVNFWVVVVEQW